MGNELKLIITTDASGAITALRSVGNEVKSVESNLSSFAGRIQKNWFAISAAITAAAGTVYKAWDLMDQAASFADQKASLQSLATAYGTSAGAIIKSIKDMSNGMISMSDIVDVSLSAMTKNLDPSALIELAKYADAVGDTMRTSAADGFRTLAEAAALGRERTMESIVGVIDLNAALGSQTNRMTDSEKANARLNIMLTRLRDIYPEAGTQSLSFGDKMEQLKVTVKDLELQMGTGLIRAFAGVSGAFQWLAAGALQLYGYLLKIPEALAWLQSKTGVTEKIRAEGKAWMESLKSEQQAAFEAAGGLAVKAADNFSAMTASSADLAAAMAKVRTGGGDNKAWLKEVAEATAEWKNRIMEMNPALDKWDMQLLKLSQDIEKANLEGKVPKKVLDEAWVTGVQQVLLKKEEEALAERNKLREEQMRNDFESYKEEVGISQERANDLLAIDEDIKKKSIARAREIYEARLESFAGLVPAYKEATDLAQKWGESEIEFSERVLAEKKKWVETLEHAKTQLEDTGQIGTQAYRDILGALGELALHQKIVSSDFVQGWDQGIKDYVKSTEWGFDRGRQILNDFAREGERFLIDMWEDPKNAVKNFGAFLLAQIKLWAAQTLMNPIMINLQGIFGGTGAAGAVMSGSSGGLGALSSLLQTGAGKGIGSYFSGLMNYQLGGTQAQMPSVLSNLNGTNYGSFGTLGQGLGLAGGLYGLYNAYQTKSPAMGAVSGAMAGYSAAGMIGTYAGMGSSLGPWGMAIGAIIGAVVGLLGKGKGHSQTAISYDPDRESGAWAIRHEEMFPKEAATQFKTSMEKWRGTLKDMMTAIGGDVSRFDQDWVSGRAALKKKNTVERLFDFFFSSYTEWVTGVDFNQFKKDGEELSDTIGSIVAAVMNIKAVGSEEVAGKAGMTWDVKTIYEKINLKSDTFTEAMAKLDTAIGEGVEALNSMTGMDWRNQLEAVSSLITQRYEAEVQYLTYIKGLTESITQSIGQQIEGFQLSVMDHKQQIDFYNQKVNSLFEMLQQASDPQMVESLVMQIQQYMSSGWGVLSDTEKQKSLQDSTRFLEEVNRTAQEKLNAAVELEQQAVQDLAGMLAGIDFSPLLTLTSAAQNAADALNNLSTSAGWKSPVYMPWVPAASGIDNIEYDNMPIFGHKNESVITAKGNTALGMLVKKVDQLLAGAAGGITIILEGDAGPIIQAAKVEGAKEAIRIIRKDPRVLELGVKMSVSSTIQTLRAHPGLLER